MTYPHEYVVTFGLETIVDRETDDGSFPPWPRHKPIVGAFLTSRWSPAGYSFQLAARC